jgi:hypothetical protein
VAIALDSSGSTLITTSVSTANVDITTAATGATCYALLALGVSQASNVTWTGWTSVLEGNEGTATHYALYRRVKVAGDTTFAVSWPTATKGTLGWASYTGGDQTTFDELAAATLHTSAGTTYPTPSLTPTGSGRWALTGTWSRSTTTANQTESYTPDAALTERVDVNNGTNPWVPLELADSNGTVTVAAHSYTATMTTTGSSASESHGGALLVYLIPAAGGATVSGAAALAGSGTLGAAGSATVFAAAAVSAAGTLGGVGTNTAVAASALAGSGALAATALCTAFAAGSLAGGGTLTTAGLQTSTGAASLSGTGTLGAAGARATFGAAALTAAGALAAAGLNLPSVAANLSATGALAADGIQTIRAAAGLAAAGTLTATGAIPTATGPPADFVSVGGLATDLAGSPSTRGLLTTTAGGTASLASTAGGVVLASTASSTQTAVIGGGP